MSWGKREKCLEEKDKEKISLNEQEVNINIRVFDGSVCVFF